MEGNDVDSDGDYEGNTKEAGKRCWCNLQDSNSPNIAGRAHWSFLSKSCRRHLSAAGVVANSVRFIPSINLESRVVVVLALQAHTCSAETWDIEVMAVRYSKREPCELCWQP